MNFGEYTSQQDTLNYFVYLVEDRMGRSAEIVKKSSSVEIQLHDGASIDPEEAHLFCVNLMVSIMETFGVFVPFKLYNEMGDLITFETYAGDESVNSIASHPLFIVNEEDEENIG